MGRFSPTVGRQPLDLGSVIDSFLKSFAFTRGQREERQQRERQNKREDWQDRMAEDRQRTLELTQPGARTFADYVNDPLNYSNSGEMVPAEDQTPAGFRRAAETETPVTNLAAMANAGQRGVEPQLRPAEPDYIAMPGRSVPMAGGVRMPLPMAIPGRSPFVTKLGTVMDPNLARQQATLADAIERRNKLESLRDELTMRQELGPWEPRTREERISFQHDLAAATGLLGQREGAAAASRTRADGGGGGMPRGLTLIQKEIDDLQQDISTQIRLAQEPDMFASDVEREFASQQKQLLMQMIAKRDALYAERDQAQAALEHRAIGGGTDDATRTPPPDSIRRPAPADTGTAGRGAAAGQVDLSGYAPGGAPTATLDPDLVARAKKVQASHPSWTADQISEELRRQDEEAQGGPKKK